MTYLLDDKIAFPHPSLADTDGLLAIGGDLSIQRLRLAYAHGIFPWFSEDTPILWYAPHERFVLLPEELHLSKSMKQFIRHTDLTVDHNTSFTEVIQHCANIERQDQDGTWITEEMQAAYQELYRQGCAHSIEVFDADGFLVGGLYGVQVGRVFCGESMFAKVSNASKLALVYLCQAFNFELIDCQIYSAHLASLGARMMPGETYYHILQQQTRQHEI